MTTILLPNVKAGLGIGKAMIPHIAAGFCLWWNPATTAELARYKGKRGVQWSAAKERFEAIPTVLDDREALALLDGNGRPRLLKLEKVTKFLSRQFASGRRIPGIRFDEAGFQTAAGIVGQS